MSELLFTDTRYFYDSMELTGYSNEISLGYKAEVHDTTKFKAGGSRWRTSGLTEIDFSSSGFWDAGSTTNLITNGTFTTNTTGWTAVACTLSVVGNALSVNADSGSEQYAWQAFNTKPGKTYTVEAYAQDGDEASEAFYIGAYSGSVGAAGTLVGIATGTTAAGSVAYSFDFIAITETSHIRLVKNTTFAAAPGYILFDTASVVEKSGEPDSELFTSVGNAGVDQCITICPEGTTEGNLSYFFNGLSGSYMVGGNIGELLPYDVTVHGEGTPLCRGVVLGYGLAKISTSQTTGQDLRTGSTATSDIRICLHVLSVSGTSPTLDVKIQQDTEVAFGDSPSDTTGAAFAQATATKSEYIDLTAVTTGADDCFRVHYTIGGTNPSFSFIVSIEIIG